MDAFAGPYAAAALLLVVAGVLEVRRPGPTVEALHRLGVNVSVTCARGCAALGALVGVLALGAGGGTLGRVAAALVALAYLGFAGFVAATLVRVGPLASCGCFGRDDTPPSITHLIVNVTGAVAAAAVVIQPGDGFRGAVAHQPGAGIPFLLVTALCTVLAYLVFTGWRGRRRSGAGGGSPRAVSG